MNECIIDPRQISSGLELLLESFGVRVPFTSELIKVGVKHWVGSLTKSDLERFMSTIKVAKRSGRNLGKLFSKIDKTEAEEDKAFIMSLFIAFLLASLFQSLNVD